MKPIAPVLLAAALVLTACGGSDPEPTSTTPTTGDSVSTASQPPSNEPTATGSPAAPTSAPTTAAAITPTPTPTQAAPPVGGGTDPASVTAALSASIMEDQEVMGDDELTLTQEQADCMANGMVNGLGVAQLQEYGVIDANGVPVDSGMDDTVMSPEHATTMVDAMFTCVDFVAYMQESMAAEMETGDNPEIAACIQEALSNLSEEDWKQAMVDSLSGVAEEQAMESLFGPLMACAFMGLEDMMSDMPSGMEMPSGFPTAIPTDE